MNKLLLVLLFFSFADLAQALCVEKKFSDSDLNEWLERKKNGLILIVSSGMPYSEMSIVPVENEARNRKISLLILSDRNDRLQKSKCYPVLSSTTLIQKGALRHFPTLFAVKNRRLEDRVIPGIQTEAELKKNLDLIYK